MQEKNLKNWTAEQLQYIDRLADPDERRTKEQLSKDLGIGRTTLWTWEQKEGFQEEVYQRAMHYLRDFLPEALSVLRSTVRKRNVDALKLLLQHTGKLVEKVQEEVKVTISWEEEE